MATVQTTYYTTIQKVADFLGLYRKVRPVAPVNPVTGGQEAVGTGDSSTATWALQNYNIIPGSEAIYVNGTLKTVTTHYTLDADGGTITFTAGNIPGVVAITANYSYIDVPPSVISNYINRAEEMIERRVGRSFKTTATITAELYDGDAVQEVSPYAFGPPFSSGFQSSSPSDNYYIKGRILPLKYYPILTVTSISVDGTALSASDYVTYLDAGYIALTETGAYKFTLGQQNISVTYTYGYASVPKIVEDLCTRLAGVNVIESLLLGDPSENLNIKEQNVAIIRTQAKLLYETLGEMLEVRRL